MYRPLFTNRRLRPLKNDAGLIDLASIMVGAVVLGAVSSSLSATVFEVVPWSQNEATKQSLSAVSTAQAVASVRGDGYASFDELVEAKYLPAAAATAINLNIALGDSDGCYVAVATSPSGDHFWTDNKKVAPAKYKAGDASDCADLTELLPTAPVISTSTVPASVKGQAYSFQLVASDRAATWAVTAGEMPAGLELSKTGVISGTPTTTGGNVSVTVTATNSEGSHSQELRFAVNETPAISTESLPKARVGTPYKQTLTATGTPKPTWELTGGTLPAGVTFQDGVLEGTPTTRGAAQLTFTVTNAAGTASKELALTVEEPPVIAGGALPSGSSDVAYSHRIGATGQGVTFAVTAGSLPAGITLSNDGVLSGTPERASSNTITVAATNADGADSRQFTFTVNAATVQLIADGGFNTGVSHWVHLSNGLDAPVTNNYLAVKVMDNAKYKANFAVKPGEALTLSLDIRVSSNGFAEPYTTYYDAAGKELPTSDHFALSGAIGAWKTVGGPVNPPAGAVSMTLTVWGGISGTGTDIDNVSLTVFR